MPNYKTRLIDMMALNDIDIPDDAQIFISDDIQYQIDTDDTLDNNTTLPADFYGVVAPPFNTFWVEARTDTKFFDDPDLLDVITAATITVQSLDEARDLLRENTNYFRINKPEAYEAKWVYFIKAQRFEYYRGYGKNIYISTHTAVLPIGEDGIAIFDEKGVAVSAIEYTTLDLARVEQQVRAHNATNPEYKIHILPASMVASVVPIVLRTIGALHKRVEILETTYSEKAKRKTKKRFGYTPRNNYYLKVGDKVRPYSGLSVSGRKRKDKVRTHYRAGHFKYYSEERPHVSGFTGMMWVNSTMVARSRDDQITKRYEVTDND